MIVPLTTASCVATDPAAPRIQGWTAAEQSWWYEGTQGSRLIPYAWFAALETPSGGAPFPGADHMASFGFLPRTTSFGAALPVGFALDDGDDNALEQTKLRWFAGQSSRQKWVGFNCSACHTGEIAYGDQRLRIDGGPSLVDFQRFIEALDASLMATLATPARFDRFARNVLKDGHDTPAERMLLRMALERLAKWQDRVAAQNDTPLRYGSGRVDAFGHIYNQVALFADPDAPSRNPPDAPVSYPFLWGISRHDKLQWNGIAQNARIGLGGNRYLDYGALGRNTGEVIGVFGEVATVPGASPGGYGSSIQADNLIRLETQLARLRRPAWPAFFAAPRPEQVAAGARLYQAHCAACHAVLPADDAATTIVPIRMVEFRTTLPVNRTDPWMACNAFTYQARTGRLNGTKAGYVSGDPLPETVPLATLLPTMVKGTLIGKKGQIISNAATTFAGFQRPPRVVTTETGALPQTRAQRLAFCLANPDPLLAYKARPLEGIWATAPYLHNGSVPSLYDLLLPARARPRCFDVGGRDYDPVHVGYAYDRALRCDRAAAVPAGKFRFFVDGADGKPIDGNDNAGHDYGAAEMTEADRLALVAFMTTL